jgi:hypothetical protein
MASNTTEALRGLPEVLPFESPGSWLSRAAQSQGVLAAELMRYLGLRPTLDVDFVFLSGRFRELARACDLGPNAFVEARRVMESLRTIDPKGEKFLFRLERKARYRLCPRCLKDCRTPHFTLQCRLEAWRCCPTHGCMMEEGCWRCGAAVALPLSPGIDGSREAHAHSLAQCLQCGAKHRDAPTADLEIGGERFGVFERLIIDNGKAVPAALYQRRVVIQGDRAHSLAYLMQLYKMGLLARKGYGPTAARWRARAEDQE